MANQQRKYKTQAVWCFQNIISESFHVALKPFRVSSNLIAHVSPTEIFLLMLD